MTPGAEIARASETPEATQDLMQRWAEESRLREITLTAAKATACTEEEDD